MQDHDVFWKLEALSNRQLLDRMGTILGSSRRLLAELIAHLGEVEERRLHLIAACSSMFAYCLKLGMTEDEAYRRIEVARLARCYPAIFPLLADGQLTISVVALLKHHLSDENHLELLAAVQGRTVVQARELIAARFPRPDVPTSVRKLPERRAPMQPSLTLSMAEEPRANCVEPRGAGMEPCIVETAPHAVGAEPRFTSNETAPRTAETAPRTAGTAPRTAETAPRTAGTAPRTAETAPRFTSNVTSSTEVPASPAIADLARTGGSPEEPLPPTYSERAAPPRVSSRIEPLSAQRYKVQFTASAQLARKLELARDLMRHSHPGGELGPIVERAMDLLIESLMRRRFGKTKKASPKRPRARVNPGQRGDVAGDRLATRHTAEHDAAEPERADPASAEPERADPASAEPERAKPDTPALADAMALADATAHGIRMHDGAADPDIPTTLDSADIEADHRAEGERSSPPSYIPRFTRRTVLERDGLCCSWVDEQGTRCGSRAWLEYDHCHPRAKGGGSEPDNLRLLCRHHNQFAAEQEYGRRHVEQTIAERRHERAPHAPHAI